MPEGKQYSQAAFARMWHGGVSTAEMAAHFDCSTRTITKRANALKLPKRKGGVASKYDCRLLAKMYADGVGTREIAAALGLPSPTHVPRMIAAMGLPRRSQASGRWGVTVTADEWHDGLLSRAMARTAAQEQASMINAEMADGAPGGGKLVGQRKAGGCMMARFEINNERLKKLWDDGHSVTAIKTEFGCHENTIRYRLKLMGLGNREREAGVENNRGKRPMGHKPTERFAAKPAKRPLPAQPAQHIAAVRMPAEPLEDRADWADLKAAVLRAKAGPAPVASMGIVAARYRLPVAVVQGLAGRVVA